MKVAVYNRHWATAGGGERYAGAFAQALAEEHEVDVLAHDELDWRQLEERLGLDLGRTRPVVIDDGRLERATARYDLLVNCSYMSADRCGARAGLYVVLFPTPFEIDLSWKRRMVTRLVGRWFRERQASLEWGTGFHLPESSRFHRFRWTSGEASLLVGIANGRRVPVRLEFGPRPREAGPTDVTISVDGRPSATASVGVRRRATSVDLTVAGRGEDDPVRLTIESPTFVPAELAGAGDTRRLGVPLRAVSVGNGLTSALARRLPWLVEQPVTLEFLSTYDRIVSISRFTAEWVRRSWDRPSDVLYPPVFEIAPGEKEPIILAVGRFFDRASGHSKKQLELVRAFRRLLGDRTDAWELHLVGGCAPEHAGYLERVRREAAGLPVVFHVDASGEELRALYRRASIFWHATGLGESERRRPHRLEHFGITTVEAMSAGAVPVVIGRGGQLEIVEEGKSGLFFSSLDELVAKTRSVIDDERLRRRLSEGARVRAREFSYERFAERARALAEGVAPARAPRATR